MASFRADGHEVPFILRLNDKGIVGISSHLLSIRFGFIEYSIYLEEEVHSSSGSLLESVLIPRVSIEEGMSWLLGPGRYSVWPSKSSKSI